MTNQLRRLLLDGIESTRMGSALSVGRAKRTAGQSASVWTRAHRGTSFQFKWFHTQLAEIKRSQQDEECKASPQWDYGRSKTNERVQPWTRGVKLILTCRGKKRSGTEDFEETLRSGEKQELDEELGQLWRLCSCDLLPHPSSCFSGWPLRVCVA